MRRDAPVFLFRDDDQADGGTLVGKTQPGEHCSQKNPTFHTPLDGARKKMLPETKPQKNAGIAMILLLLKKCILTCACAGNKHFCGYGWKATVLVARSYRRKHLSFTGWKNMVDE